MEETIDRGPSPPSTPNLGYFAPLRSNEQVTPTPDWSAASHLASDPLFFGILPSTPTPAEQFLLSNIQQPWSPQPMPGMRDLDPTHNRDPTQSWSNAGNEGDHDKRHWKNKVPNMIINEAQIWARREQQLPTELSQEAINRVAALERVTGNNTSFAYPGSSNSAAYLTMAPAQDPPFKTVSFDTQGRLRPGEPMATEVSADTFGGVSRKRDRDSPPAKRINLGKGKEVDVASAPPAQPRLGEQDKMYYTMLSADEQGFVEENTDDLEEDFSPLSAAEQRAMVRTLLGRMGAGPELFTGVKSFYDAIVSLVRMQIMVHLTDLADAFRKGDYDQVRVLVQKYKQGETYAHLQLDMGIVSTIDDAGKAGRGSAKLKSGPMFYASLPKGELSTQDQRFKAGVEQPTSALPPAYNAMSPEPSSSQPSSSQPSFSQPSSSQPSPSLKRWQRLDLTNYQIHLTSLLNITCCHLLFGLFNSSLVLPIIQEGPPDLIALAFTTALVRIVLLSFESGVPKPIDLHRHAIKLYSHTRFFYRILVWM
ncbi:hypothetical protein Hypma_011131 [Hypsizygus marmoreus]|uniref:Uncharacterized protein n=1 Tax=Hypsizygus marmoreus TaxID=39966 RepID=A0A369JQD7_HYPMA|nr:hypothetical protein Hypma_011131 [Hypsizygus marmoreus]